MMDDEALRAAIESTREAEKAVCAAIEKIKVSDETDGIKADKQLWKDLLAANRLRREANRTLSDLLEKNLASKSETDEK